MGPRFQPLLLHKFLTGTSASFLPHNLHSPKARVIFLKDVVSVTPLTRRNHFKVSYSRLSFITLWTLPTTLVSQKAPHSLQSPTQAPSIWNILLLPPSSYTQPHFSSSLPTQVSVLGTSIMFSRNALLSEWCNDPSASVCLSRGLCEAGTGFLYSNTQHQQPFRTLFWPLTGTQLETSPPIPFIFLNWLPGETKNTLFSYARLQLLTVN